MPLCVYAAGSMPSRSRSRSRLRLRLPRPLVWVLICVRLPKSIQSDSAFYLHPPLKLEIISRVLVLIAIQDEGSREMSEAAYKALEKFGAQDPLKENYRSSYALLGWSGPGVPNFITQVCNL